jgi:hypothetical protein
VIFVDRQKCFSLFATRAAFVCSLFSFLSSFYVTVDIWYLPDGKKQQQVGELWPPISFSLFLSFPPSVKAKRSEQEQEKEQQEDITNVVSICSSAHEQRKSVSLCVHLTRGSFLELPFGGLVKSDAKFTQ